MIADRTADAKKLIAHGFKIFPCRQGEKIPATAHGCKDATDDPAKIDGQFIHGENVAIATGHRTERGYLAVIDFDAPAGADEFQAENSPFPETVCSATPRGGKHFYFYFSREVKNSQSKLADKVDVRGTGGHVLCQPSTVGGNAYEWMPGCSPEEIQIADAPTWLEQLVCVPDAPPRPAPRPTTYPTSDAGSHWLKKALAKATEGNRNATGLWLATQLRDAGLSESTARDVMRQYAASVPQGEKKYLESEALRSLKSAYSRPPREPAVSRPAADAPATPATPTASTASASKLSYVDISKCREPRPAAWIVPGWIPARQVTGLGANGGTGKSTFALQLAAAQAIGAAFLGDAQEPMRCLYHSAEDGLDVVLPRLERICDALAVPPEELAKNLRIINAEDNPTLVEPAAKTLKPVTTRIYALLAAAVQQWQPHLIVIDGASDTFDGDENSRRDVRTYIHALRRLAAISRAGVILITHVNRRAAEGGKTDQHFSGSTAWNNSVRSRVALIEDDFATDRLTLLHEKSNLGPRQKPMTFARDPATGLFAPMHADAVDTTTEQRALLRILMDFEGRGEKVHTATRGPYATYTTLAGEPGFPRWKKGAFDAAIRTMERAGYLARETSQNSHRHETVHWKVTPLGELFATANNGVKNDPKTGVKNDEKIDPETGEILQGVKNENP